MSSKRSRSAYESDSAAPFAYFGTPIVQTSDAGDGGSYVPLHNQEVRDDRGRRRLHGAFTGGWSAGYFNTVGSKEGWTPSQFKSSRESRRAVDSSRAQNLPQTFMDEEDLADAAESQKLGTSQSFTGIGARDGNTVSENKILSMLHMKTETTGVMLLKRMGWRDGQGIGPKVSRKPRLDNTRASNESNVIVMASSYLFAPDDVIMASPYKKTDRGGLGVHNPEGLTRQHPDKTGRDSRLENSELRVFGGLNPTNRVAHDRPSGRGFGVGVLNDSSSGEDDPYEIGPKITHIRRVRSAKKTKKSSTKGQGAGQIDSSISFRDCSPDGTCRGGQSPIGGFVRGTTQDEADTTSHLQISVSIPLSWAPSRRAGASAADNNAQMHAQKSGLVAFSSAARGLMLGKPGAPGQHILGRSSGSAQDADAFSSRPLQPTRQAVEAALKRDLEGNGLYRSQPSKQARYHMYLEHHAGLGTPAPTKPDDMADLEFSRELQEFYNCVAIFKPMAAPMASRFTAAASLIPAAGSEAATGPSYDRDAPRDAARSGMFGSMTRSVAEFAPCSLLCRRFNIKASHSGVSTGGHGQSPGPLVGRVGSTSDEVPRPGDKGDSAATGRGAGVKGPYTEAAGNGPRGENTSKQVFDAIFGDE